MTLTTNHITQMPADTAAPARVPLRTYRWKRNPPAAWISGQWLTLSMPTYFGNREWRLPLSEVAVVDTRDDAGPVCRINGSSSESVDGEVEQLRFNRDLLVPYLATTASISPPTTGVLFRRPQRVPFVRSSAVTNPAHPFPFSAKQTRTEPGAFLDGVLLRELHPGQLAEAASARGLDLATGIEWFAAHRDVASDDTRASHETPMGRTRMVESSGLASAAAGGGLFWAAQSHGWSPPVGRVALLMLVGGAGAAAIADRYAVRRAHRAAQAEADDAHRGAHELG